MYSGSALLHLQTCREWHRNFSVSTYELYYVSPSSAFEIVFCFEHHFWTDPCTSNKIKELKPVGYDVF
jgi:hypothetical protein